MSVFMRSSWPCS